MSPSYRVGKQCAQRVGANELMKVGMSINTRRVLDVWVLRYHRVGKQNHSDARTSEHTYRDDNSSKQDATRGVLIRTRERPDVAKVGL